MTNRIAAILAASILTSIALVGCGGAGASASGSANLTVLPSGSNLTAFGDRVRLNAGAGAVTNSQIILVTESTNDTLDANIVNGTVFDFSPNAFNFNTSVALTIRYNENNLNGSAESGLTLVKRSGSGWVDVGGSVVDESGNTVTANITALGKYAIRRS
jgi:hypothetical protein